MKAAESLVVIPYITNIPTVEVALKVNAPGWVSLDGSASYFYIEDNMEEEIVPHFSDEELNQAIMNDPDFYEFFKVGYRMSKLFDALSPEAKDRIMKEALGET